MWRNECSKEKLLLNYDRPQDFVRCFWQKKEKVSLLWIVYRVVIVVYITTGFLAVLTNPSPLYDWKKSFIYFTYWAYMGLILTFVLCLGIAVKRYRDEKKDPEIPPLDVMPNAYKATWCVYNIAAPSALGVSIMFWVFVYDPVDYSLLTYTLLTHVFNTMTVLLDFSLTGIPFRFLHIYMPSIFCIVYVLFTITYQLSGGTGELGEIPIYKILDWRNPKMAMSTVAVCLGCITFTHCTFCVINMVKIFLKKFQQRGTEVEDADV